MTRVSIRSIELSPLECEVLSEILAAKLEQHLADRAKYMKPRAVMAADAVQNSGASLQKASDGNMVDAGQTTGPANPAFSPCLDCSWLAEDGDGPCATHRRACEGCGRSEGLHDGDPSLTKCGPNGAPIVERWCDHCDPPPAVGEKYADAQLDPWSLADEELSLTAELPREEPKYWGRDRGEFDPLDDKSDIQPFGRTTK